MRLDEVRKLVRAHADVCIDPTCHRLANALEGAEYAEALRLIRESVDPDDRTTVGIPPWSEVSWPSISRAWPSALPEDN